MKERRYLRKIGGESTGLRLFGWTPALAAKKDMIECDKKGEGIVSQEQIQKEGVSQLRTFELGMTFRTVGEKTLKGWLEENAVEINAMGLDIQGLIIAKWQKCFGSGKMPKPCTFMVSDETEDEKIASIKARQY